MPYITFARKTVTVSRDLRARDNLQLTRRPQDLDSNRSGATPVLRAIGATSHIFGAPRTLRARRAC